MSKRVLELLGRRHATALIATHSQCGDDTAVIHRDHLAAVAQTLRDDPESAMDMPIDVTAVDFMDYPEPRPHATRFVVVYHLRSTTHNHRVRLQVPVPDDDLRLPSLVPVWPGVNWPEREVWDLFGITFTEHPDLRRILLYPQFLGHPLRKDYPLRGYQPLTPMPTLRGDAVPGLPTTADGEDSHD